MFFNVTTYQLKLALLTKKMWLKTKSMSRCLSERTIKVQFQYLKTVHAALASRAANLAVGPL